MKKAILKFLYFNAILYATDNGPYYQVMIATIVEYDPRAVDPTGYQIARIFLYEAIKELNNYLESKEKVT